MSVTELLDRALAGDRQAENRLFESLHARIFAVAKRRIPDSQEAQDLTQDVLRTAFERYRDAGPADAFLPWLFTILRNKIGNYMRHRRVKTRVWEGGTPLPRWTGSGESTGAGTNSSTTPEIAAIDLADSLVKALRTASPECQKIFRLLLMGAERKEIHAAFDGEAVGTVDSRVSRCRERLLRAMEALSSQGDHE